MRELGRLLIAASFVVVGTSLAAQGGAEAPQDVKGWRGAELGMTPEQAAAALNRALGKATQNRWYKAIWSYDAGEVAVGEWTAGVELTFRESGGSRQLVEIDLRFPERTWNRTSPCDEFIATYGRPRSLNHGHVLGEQRLPTDLTIWQFPSIRITCQRITLPPNEMVLNVRFQQPVKPYWMLQN